MFGEQLFLAIPSRYELCPPPSSPWCFVWCFFSPSVGIPGKAADKPFVAELTSRRRPDIALRPALKSSLHETASEAPFPRRREVVSATIMEFTECRRGLVTEGRTPDLGSWRGGPLKRRLGKLLSRLLSEELAWQRSD